MFVFHYVCPCILLVLLIGYSLKYVGIVGVFKKLVCPLLRHSWPCQGFGHPRHLFAILLSLACRVVREELSFSQVRICETGGNLEIWIVFHSCLEASDE